MPFSDKGVNFISVFRHASRSRKETRVNVLYYEEECRNKMLTSAQNRILLEWQTIAQNYCSSNNTVRFPGNRKNVNVQKYKRTFLTACRSRKILCPVSPVCHVIQTGRERLERDMARHVSLNDLSPATRQYAYTDCASFTYQPT
jgi:hypothetical protein